MRCAEPTSQRNLDGYGTPPGIWYFNSGPRTRKSRNLAANPRCVVSVATQPFDLVVEGSAERVRDGVRVRHVRALRRHPLRRLVTGQ